MYALLTALRTSHAGDAAHSCSSESAGFSMLPAAMPSCLVLCCSLLQRTARCKPTVPLCRHRRANQNCRFTVAIISGCTSMGSAADQLQEQQQKQLITEPTALCTLALMLVSQRLGLTAPCLGSAAAAARRCCCHTIAQSCKIAGESALCSCSGSRLMPCPRSAAAAAPHCCLPYHHAILQCCW